MKVSVVGCGRWGSFIAWYLDKIGHSVTLYGRPSSKNIQQLLQSRTNGTVTLNEGISLTTNLADVVLSDTIVISVSSQSLRSVMQQLTEYDISHKTFVLCMKGIEVETGKRLSQIVAEYTDAKTAVWIGPGHVQEFVRKIPNCMVIDSADFETTQLLVSEFSSELIRFYYGSDLLGNEIGAAAKNVVGIAAGMLDGLGLSSLKGALMSRAPREIARLIKAMGGNELSVYGLCHLGDYEATVFSKYSHNRRFGEAFVKGEEYTELAEGYYTVKALILLSKQYGVELPVCQAVYDMLYKKADVSTVFQNIFFRSLKQEF